MKIRLEEPQSINPIEPVKEHGEIPFKGTLFPAKEHSKHFLQAPSSAGKPRESNIP